MPSKISGKNSRSHVSEKSFVIFAHPFVVQKFSINYILCHFITYMAKLLFKLFSHCLIYIIMASQLMISLKVETHSVN